MQVRICGGGNDPVIDRREGDPILTIALAICVVMLHLQILQEEKYMETTFGESYLQYKKKVFRYLGRR